MRSFFVLFMVTAIFGEDEGSFICTSGRSICIPKNYSKYDLPETKTKVSLGIDIMDIPNIDDNNFSVTFIAYLDIVWKDPRLIMTSDSANSSEEKWIPMRVDESFINELWLPDLLIKHLKDFRLQEVLSKLEGIWINQGSITYNIRTKITFLCPMAFDNFPLDTQICPFQVKYMCFCLQIFQG